MARTTTKKKVPEGEREEHYILLPGNHPTSPNRLVCLVCDSVHRLNFGPRGSMPVDDLLIALKGFAALHQRCTPATPDAVAELNRRLFAARRDYGTSSNELAAYAAGGPAPVQGPLDTDDLAACYRRFLRTPLAQQARMASFLERYRRTVSGDLEELDGVLIAEGIAWFFLFAWWPEARS